LIYIRRHVTAQVRARTWKGEISMSEQLAYSPTEAAELGGISLAKLYEEVRNNRLIIRKSGRRSLITHRDLEAWLDGLPKKPAPLASSAAA
jgi:excisionase family DNA binding protein